MPLDLPRFRQLAHQHYCRFLPSFALRATPYEQSGVIGGSIGRSVDPNYIILTDNGGSSLAVNEFTSHRSTRPGKGSRIDIRLVSATFSGTGWDFNFEIPAPVYYQNQFKRGMGMAVWLQEFTDKNEEGVQSWGCLFNQQVGQVFIKDVSSRQSARQENIIMITASTPDRFLEETNIDKMPYLLKSIVDAERALQTSLSRTNESLHFPAEMDLRGSGAITTDPFAGFANFIDTWLASGDALLTPRPANENHFLGGLSVQKALFNEYLKNHVLANRGDGFRSILDEFPTEIDLSGDVESGVPNVEIGPGSVQNAILESLKHGSFRYWWTAKSKMCYKPDYSAYAYGSVAPAFIIRDGKSCIGSLEVQLGPSPESRINRVAVRGEMLTGAAGGAEPLANYFVSGLGGAVYPAGRGITGQGQDVVFENYVGQKVNIMARRLYSRKNQFTTAQLKGFPFASLAFALAGRPVGIAIRHPMLAYDWTPGAMSPIGLDVGSTGGAYGSAGKMFSVDSVSIQNTDPEAPGGGTFLAELGMTEIIPLN